MSVTRRQAAGGSGVDEAPDAPSAAAAKPRQSGPEVPPALRHLEDAAAEIRARVGRLGLRGGCVLLASVLLSFLFYWHLARYVFVTRHSEDAYFLGMETCPACFGNDFCHRFANSEVTFTGAYQYPIAHRLTPDTRVFEGRRGRFHGDPVVIKSLATPRQLAGVERSLCDFANLRGRRCNMRDALWKRLPLGEDTLALTDVQGVSDMFRCPSRRLLGVVKDAFRLRDPDRPVRLPRNEEMSLLFTAMVNPEPLMLMTFPSESGWPFPKYHGACGRFIVVEHRGKPASDYLDAGLPDRLLVASRILQLALRLTGSDTGFALYPSDWDLSNFAVFPATSTVTLVDLSNVTVVDTRDVSAPAGQQPQHHVTREAGSWADAQAVCRHRLSDWNVLAACDLLLRTLLRDQAPGNRDLSLCASSGDPPAGVSRFQLAKAIIDAIDKQLQLRQ